MGDHSSQMPLILIRLRNLEEHLTKACWLIIINLIVIILIIINLIVVDCALGVHKMFVGRTQELAYLNERFDVGKFELAVMYGRRRVGKTTLINEFIRGKDVIFYTGMEGNAKENLEGLSKSIFSFVDEFKESAGSLSSFEEALETVFRISETRRITFVIDEYPYIAASYGAISSILQTLIDKYKSKSKLFLILCGSTISFMEEQVLGYKSPLFGRRTCQFKILPFEFFEVQSFFQKFDPIDLAVIYGITGGIPLYMSLMNDNLTVRKNIENNFLIPNAYLFDEPGNLIKQECRNPAQYNSIIRAIATGSSKMSEICSKTGLDTALTNSYLAKLISLGIIKKETPFGEKATKKTIYRITDGLFRFWYRFIPENMTLIQRGLKNEIYNKIQPQFTGFMGLVFEDICMQYLWKLRTQGDTKIEFSDLGRWWGNDPINRREAEIDIMGTDGTNAALFCECKWTNEKVDLPTLNALLQKGNLFYYTEKHFYLFAKAGFTKGCQEEAKKHWNVSLVEFAEMI